ncbi:MAG: hypothetical protein K2N99_01755, partial [Malacoplasma sp.]|nr:hypothetical protein [Malacoplasma sp.]
NISAVNSKVQAVLSTSGIYVEFVFTDSRGVKVRKILNMYNLSSSGVTYSFEKCTQLKYFNINSQILSDFKKDIRKFVATSLFTFIITTDKKLYVIDEERIIDAVTFENDGKGWTDKDSLIYMNPESDQELYYLNDNAYLQNILDIAETPNGIYISDKYGLYELQTNKNLICRMEIEDNQELIAYLPHSNRTFTEGKVIILMDNSKRDFVYHTYLNDYSKKLISTERLRYNYLDLFNSNNYQLYKEDKVDYESDKPIIDFKATLYCTFIDKMSVIYNTSNNDYITVDKTTYSEVKKLNPQKYIVLTNKYGFIKYDNLLDIPSTNNSRVATINEIKTLRFVHNKGDNLTYEDVIKTIRGLLDKALEERTNDLSTINSDSFEYKTNNQHLDPNMKWYTGNTTAN